MDLASMMITVAFPVDVLDEKSIARPEIVTLSSTRLDFRVPVKPDDELPTWSVVPDPIRMRCGNHDKGNR